MNLFLFKSKYSKSGMIRKIGQKILFFHRRLLLVSLSIITSVILKAQQREYSFNSPGSKCYFKYVCFTADSNYTMTRRPFIFILGDENVTASELFERDTLKNSQQFQNYYFVYLPGSGITGGQKLGCIEALASLLTFNFRYGRSNLFFQVNDTIIKRNDINLYGLRTVFKSIRLSCGEKLSC